MNPWPGPQSVLLMDNCLIHKSQHLQDIVYEKGLFTMPISPDTKGMQVVKFYGYLHTALSIIRLKRASIQVSRLGYITCSFHG
jgi:hypothetical protein